MAYEGFYTAGTASVANGSTAVTGSGTTWATGTSKPVAGDTFSANGLSVPIDSVTDNTHLVLGYPWPGDDLSADTYIITLDSLDRFSQASVAARIQSYLEVAARIEAGAVIARCVSVLLNTPPGSPVLDALYVVGTSPTGAWSGRASQFAQWGGASWIYSTPSDGDIAEDLTSHDLYFWSAGDTSWTRRPLTAVVERGTGISQTGNAVKIGWSALGALLATVDSTNLGKIWTDHICPSGSGYFKLPNGKMLQWGFLSFSGSDNVVTFPTAFPSACESVVPVPVVGGYLPNFYMGVNIEGPSQTGFSFHMRAITSGSVAPFENGAVYYIAMGQ